MMIIVLYTQMKMTQASDTLVKIAKEVEKGQPVCVCVYTSICMLMQ